jgi:bacterioferritin-associated ferredoxin
MSDAEADGCGGSPQSRAHRGYAANAVANYSQHRILAPVRNDGVPMYVCLCNGLTDRDLRPHTMGATGGRCSVSMVYQACGCRPQCGKCVPFVRQMLREGSDAATSAQLDGAD